MQGNHRYHVSTTTHNKEIMDIKYQHIPTYNMSFKYDLNHPNSMYLKSIKSSYVC